MSRCCMSNIKSHINKRLLFFCLQTLLCLATKITNIQKIAEREAGMQSDCSSQSTVLVVACWKEGQYHWMPTCCQLDIHIFRVANRPAMPCSHQPSGYLQVAGPLLCTLHLWHGDLLMHRCLPLHTAFVLGARTLLVAPGIATRSKGIATRSKKATSS